MNNLLKMDAQNTYDTITVMESYNFHQPINTSILYEDYEKEPNKVINLQDNRLNSANLQIDSQSLDLSVQQENVYFVRKEPITKSEINHHHKLYSDGVGISKHNLKIRQKYTVCKNLATRNLVIRNPYPNGRKVHINNNSREVTSQISQINESALFDEVANNLALILKAYVYYGKLICKCDDTQCAARIRAEYLRVKYFYFDKSLPISKEFLLRRENNKLFTKCLLLKVVEFSKFSPDEMPYEYLTKLYNGLLKWTKLKTHQLTSNVQKSLTTTGNSPAEISLPNLDFKLEFGDQNLLTRNILTRGQPGSQIMISVDPKILAQCRNTFNGQNQSACSTEINDPAQNLINFAKTNTPNMEMENNVTHQISHKNVSSIDDINRQNLQSADPRVPFYSGTMYFTENDKCMLNNDTQNSSYNTMFTEGKQMNLEDTTRSSISRDSGFTSPVTLGSPSELEYNSFQHQSSQYGIDTSALQMPSTTAITMEPNFAQEFSYAWMH